MTLAMVGRCDPGGLGSITREVHRHLRPARTLLLDLDAAGRGACSDGDYVQGDVMRASFNGGLPNSAVEWLCAPGVDTLWSAETFYDDDKVLRAARANNIRTVVHAMPELAPWSMQAERTTASAPRPTEIFVPTKWRRETLPSARPLEVPIARDRLPYRERKHVTHLFHPTGRAMLDRNGTDLLLAALPHVTAQCRLTIRAERPIEVPRGTTVDVTVIDEPAVDYWDAYPEDMDLLVLPRRYGGLCLPVQECASLGVGAILLERDPYAAGPSMWEWVTTVPVAKSRKYRMKGGMVPVHDADPRLVAAAINWCCWDEYDAERAGRMAGVWAWERAWAGPLGDRWCELLDADCEREDAA